MSLERSPPGSSLSISQAAPAEPDHSHCPLCQEVMTEEQECLILQECSHVFHNSCIETHLQSSTTCPVCNHICQLTDLRKFDSTSRSAPVVRSFLNKSRGRGARSKHYNTRSNSRNNFQENSNFSPQVGYPSTPDRNSNHPQPVSNNSNSIDYELLNRMIEAQLTKLMDKITLNTQRDNSIHTQNNSSNVFGLHDASRPRIGLSPNVNLNSNNAMSADKQTSIILNWNLKFDGSSSGLSVEEFLYRVRSLTNDNFNDDFSIICKNLHILLTGKARDWFWRYHKQVPSVTWPEFCDAIRNQYKEVKSAYDIREEIRNRKQRPNESFDAFFETISGLIDRLPSPMTETELVEIIQRNLRPDIRQDLLYVSIGSMFELRRLVQKRENFLNDEHVRRNLATRPQNSNFVARKHIAEVDEDNQIENHNELNENFVEALQKTEQNQKCWNCDTSGHHWQDCVQQRTVFCYGCGVKNVYKPNCLKCNIKKQNFPKHFPTVGPP